MSQGTESLRDVYQDSIAWYERQLAELPPHMNPADRAKIVALYSQRLAEMRQEFGEWGARGSCPKA